MTDIPMLFFATTLTVLVICLPFAFLGAVGAVRRRRLIRKVDATTAVVTESTIGLERVTADISGVYTHRPELRP